jgi:hypothetical protein
MNNCFMARKKTKQRWSSNGVLRANWILWRPVERLDKLWIIHKYPYRLGPLFKGSNAIAHVGYWTSCILDYVCFDSTVYWKTRQKHELEYIPNRSCEWETCYDHNAHRNCRPVFVGNISLIETSTMAFNLGRRIERIITILGLLGACALLVWLFFSSMSAT